MGAWNASTFDNDDALDWAFELESSNGTSFLAETLEVISNRGDEYLEAPECNQALAAAEVIAALTNMTSAKVPDNVKKWIGNQHILVKQDIKTLALNAIERIKTSSELKELWDESDHAADWYGMLSDLESRLKS